MKQFLSAFLKPKHLSQKEGDMRGPMCQVDVPVTCDETTPGSGQAGGYTRESKVLL